jgi:hypothetical protein
MSEIIVLQSMIGESEKLLESLENDVEFERQFLDMLRKKLEKISGEKTIASGHLADSPNCQLTSAARSGSLPEKILAILADGQERRATDIRKALRAQGDTCSLPSVISTLARREDVFQRVSRGIYKIKDVRKKE